MLRRRQINASDGGRVRRFAVGTLDAARWPFERALWALEDRVFWPLRERLDAVSLPVPSLPAGWRPPDRTDGAAAAVAGCGVAAVLVAALLLPGEGPSETSAEPTRVAIAQPQSRPPADRPARRALQGPPPSFAGSGGVGAAKGAGGSDDSNGPAAGSASSAGEEAGAGAETGEAGAGATASLRKPVPAGPAAMKVARRFSHAFLSYEVGKRRERAKKVFAETATPQLAEELSKRPPRLPESAPIPEARVVNLVPGPRAGKAYTISVSLLRVDLTSELRLELRKQGRGEWLVTDVRG